MMEQGQLVSAEVLPKVAKEFKKAATEGGAYTLALQGLRVKEGQFMTGVQRAGKTIFNSGFEKGLANLYGTLSEIFEDSGPQLKKLGKIFGDVFNAIAKGLEILEPVMKFAIDNFYTLVGVKAAFMLRSFTSVLTTQSYVAAAAWTRMFLPLTLALAAMDELYAMMDDTKVGALEAAYGKQINILEGTTSDIVRIGDKFYRKDDEVPTSDEKDLDMRNMTEEQFDNLGWWDKLKAIGRLQTNMTRGMFVGAATEGKGSMIGDFLGAGEGSQSRGNVTYNNNFYNTKADDVNRAVGVGTSVATQSRGK